MSLLNLIPAKSMEFWGIHTFDQPSLDSIEHDFKTWLEDFDYISHHDSGDIDLDNLVDMFNEFMSIGLS